MNSFHKVLNIAVKALVYFIIFFTVIKVNAESSNQTILLSPEKTLLSKTLVTVGIPFAPGVLKNVNLVQIFDENGKEVPIFVKPTLYWHWKESPNKTIRAIKAQFYLDKGSNVTTYRFSFNSPRNTTLDLSEALYELGTQVSSDPKKAGMRYPIVLPVVNTFWLEQSQIIPPFKGMNSDHQMTFWKKQFEWGSQLDFTQMVISNWLFDRVSSLYKGCMRTADADCYREAFLSYRFWNKHIKRDGGLKDCRGGLYISSAKKACDNKYVYLEPIKLHVALTGDDTLYDNQLIKDMAELVYHNNWQGASYDLYDDEDDVFTERHTGLSLLTLVNAYELVSDEKILRYINEHIESLYLHQNNNPDNLSPDGSFRHSWNRHEGASYPGDGNMNDRRFSPWMMENIMDALWQAHYVVSDQRIPEMIRFAGEALQQWGFADSPGYINKFGTSLHKVESGASWRNNCNKDGVLVLYSASSTANSDALIHTQNNEGWYSDNHSAETIFSLSVAYYFEKNPEKAKALKTRINEYHEHYLKNCGGTLSQTKRAFNWNNRSNYWGTYLWVLEQKGEALPYVEVPELPTEPDQSPISYRYLNAYSDSFDNGVGENWNDNNLWFMSQQYLQSQRSNLLVLNDDVDPKNQYRIELNIVLNGQHINDKGIIFSNNATEFYTARLKVGEYGGVYIYKHNERWDFTGKLIANKPVSSLLLNEYSLSIVVDNKRVQVYVDEEMHLEYVNDKAFTGKNSGVITQGSNALIDSFLLEYSPEINDGGASPYLMTISFDELDNDYWKDSSWQVGNDTINANKASQMTLKKSIDLGSDYSMELDIAADEDGKFMLYLLFNNSTSEYYTARIYSGEWGGVYLYHHSAVWDYGGKTVAQSPKQALFNQHYKLKVNVSDYVVNILLDDELFLEYQLEHKATGKNVGLHTINKIKDAKIHTLNIAY